MCRIKRLRWRCTIEMAMLKVVIVQMVKLCSWPCHIRTSFHFV